jgi:murein DD-endopeptidase MepM/ murein hydrolase activator NlpD
VSQDPEVHQSGPQTPLEAAAAQFEADAAKAHDVGFQLAAATQALTRAEARVGVARSHLRDDAVASFVDGSSPNSDNALSTSGTDDGPIRDEYLRSVTGDERDAVRHLNQARSTLKAQQASLQVQEQAAQAALAEAARAKAGLEASALPGPAVAASVSPAPPPATGGGGLPLPVEYLKNGTVDDGVDYSAPGGTPEFAMGPGVIIREGISGFGPNAPVLQITGGPLAGKAVYYGHAGPDLVPVGAQVAQGQQLTIVGYGIVGESTGPHLEIGFYPVGPNGAGRPMLEYINSVVGHSTGS